MTPGSSLSTESGRREMLPKSPLYLVFGGDLVRPDSMIFTDTNRLHVVGFFQSYDDAYKAWRGATASTMDDAHIRYFIVPLDKFLSPTTGE